MNIILYLLSCNISKRHDQLRFYLLQILLEEQLIQLLVNSWFLYKTVVNGSI